MTATQQMNLHPGIVALDERIKAARSSLRTLESMSDSTRQEADLESRISELQEQLRTVRRHRESSAANIIRKNDELKGLLALREKCVGDDLIAQVVWMQIILQRKAK